MPIDDVFVRFPLTCPDCGSESLMAFRMVAVTIAVKVRRRMRLYVPCHDLYWDANALELDQIDAYLGASWIGQASVPEPSVSPEIES